MRNEAWLCRPIGDLFQIDAGKTMSAAARGGAAMRPFLRTSNVLWDEISLDQVDVMTFSDEEFAAKRVLPGDLLVCEGGEIGRAAIWNGELDQVSFQNHLHRLRPRVKGIEPRFYVFFLQSAFTQLGLFEGAGNKTTIPNLSRNRLAVLDVPVPPLSEQRAIVSALSAVREGVKAHAELVDGAQALKRAAMRELFTRGLRGEAQKETEIGPIPESWEAVTIGDVAKQTQYGLSIRGQQQGKYPILRMNCQDDGRVVMRNLQYVDLDPATFESFRLRRGDLLFNRTNSIDLVGRTALYEVDGDAVFASYLVRLTVDEQECVPAYLNYFMNWDRTQLDIKRLASRAVGQANINATKLRTVLFPKPALDEQREIVAILDAIDRKIALHKDKRAVLEALFKSMLHKLMTGEVRVADLNLDALGRAAEAA